MIRKSTFLAPLVAAGLLVSACSYDDTPLPEAAEATTPAPATPVDCDNTSATLESTPPSTAGGPTVDDIVNRDNGNGGRGLIVIGVSADTYRMASGATTIRGFDIDIAKAIAARLFGVDESQLGQHIQWKVITAAERIPDLQAGVTEPDHVDMVVRNMTITCDRKELIDFSAPYYQATQKMLFRGEELADSYHSTDDLAGLRICAPTGSTSLTNITAANKDAIISPAPNHTGCLVKLQKGEVDAITGDDTVLAGLAAQDPFAIVPDIQPDLEPSYGEPYGVGIAQGNEDLVAFVNAVLEDLHDSGEWDQLYRKWLEDYLPENNRGATQPTPTYQ
jgi:polar amino acid transport system substrate-binding protein